MSRKERRRKGLGKNHTPGGRGRCRLGDPQVPRGRCTQPRGGGGRKASGTADRAVISGAAPPRPGSVGVGGGSVLGASVLGGGGRHVPGGALQGPEPPEGDPAGLTSGAAPLSSAGGKPGTPGRRVAFLEPVGP